METAREDTGAWIAVRPAVPADGPAFAAIYRPVVRDTAISMEVEPPDDAEMTRRIATITARFPWFAAEGDGRVVGYAYASRHRERAGYRWAVDVAAYVAQSERGRGVARALYRVLLPTLCDLGYRRALAGIALPNAASVALHRSFSFEDAGMYRRIGFKLGAWTDVLWLMKDLGDTAEPPGEPRRWIPQASPSV